MNRSFSLSVALCGCGLASVLAFDVRPVAAMPEFRLNEDETDGPIAYVGWISRKRAPGC